jgi:hypothetical protein
VSATTADDVDISSITADTERRTTETYSAVANRWVTSSNGIDYTYREMGQGPIPLVLLQPAALTAAIVELARRPSRILEPACR